MHVLVLGAGVVGVTTAYYLAELGCRVTVVDRAGDVGSGASFANAGQLSYSFTDALAKPEFVSKVPGLLAGRDPAARVHMAPNLIPWGMRFLTQCTARRARSNTLALLGTAMRSAKLMSALRERIDFDFSYRPAGKLVLLSDDGEVQSARRSTALKREHGCDVELISADKARSIEPALDEFESPFIAALYSRSDEVADSRFFVSGMCEYIQDKYGVEFRLATAADKLIRENGRVTGVDCNEPIHADAVVVCLGAWSGKLLRSVGINPHIYPVRGYSITLPAGATSPRVSVTSLRQRIVFSRLNSSVRIAGFADFAGFDTSADDDRIKTLVETARGVAPEAADYMADNYHAWGGFRPMTPSGRPCVGATNIEGLYLNTGHGMLGWTLACATGEAAANAVMQTH